MIHLDVRGRLLTPERYRELHQRLFDRFNAFSQHEDIMEAIDEWWAGPLDGLSEGGLLLLGKDDGEILAMIKRIFNRALFGGALPPKFCNLRFIPLSEPDWGRKGKPIEEQPSTRGYLDTRKCGGHVTGTINIFELPWHTRNQTQQERILFYGGTLLHEMLHSYFWTYTCRCQSCCGLPGGWSRKGEGQHGYYWQYSALLIEEAAEGFTQRLWDLSRTTSMAFEMAACDKRVSSSYLETLKLDPTKFHYSSSPRVVEEVDAVSTVLYTARKVELEERIREIWFP